MKNALTLVSLIDYMNKYLSGYRLDEILEALSKGCMKHCLDMLNAEQTEDDNGNTLKALFDFSDRIHRLSNSAKSHNNRAPVESRIQYKELKARAYKEDRVKVRRDVIEEDED